MARPRSKISIYTLAKDLGISAATVSKALSDYPQVNETTRQRVRTAAKRLGFSPTQISQRTINISVVIQRDPGAPINFKPYVSSVLEGMAQYTWANQLESSFFGGDHRMLNEINLVRELYKRQVDGALILNADVHSTFIGKLVAQSFPYACLMTADQEAGRHIVGVDERALAFRAAEFLIQLGHQAILVMVSNSEGRSGRERLAGFTDAMKKYGLRPDKDLILNPPDLTLGGLASGFQMARHALDRLPQATAIYAMDQNMAIGACRAVISTGRSIPADISVICCDDCDYHEYMSPPITSISIPTEKLAAHAARWIHRQILGTATDEDQREAFFLQPELIVRGSTGAVPRMRRQPRRRKTSSNV